MKPVEGLKAAVGGKLPQSSPKVVYMTPDKGPFECDNCEHFSAPSSCALVSGSIEPKGCCNLYTPSDNDGDEGLS